MGRNTTRRVVAILVVALVGLITAGRTEGFENIRVVQFLLIFFPGVLVGLAIAIVRAARSSRTPAQ